jgi:hypothetical protein
MGYLLLFYHVFFLFDHFELQAKLSVTETVGQKLLFRSRYNMIDSNFYFTIMCVVFDSHACHLLFKFDCSL